MSTIKKRGKYWYYYRYANRSQFCVTLKVTERSAAVALQKDLDLKYAREDFGIRRVSVPLIEDFFRQYGLWIGNTKRDAWGTRIRIMLRNFTAFMANRPERRLDEIDFETLSAYFETRSRAMSAKTVSEDMRAVRNALEWAVASDMLENIKIQWEILTPTSGNQRHFPYFTQAEVDAIFESGLPDVPFFKVLYYTGLRSVDVANLRRENLDFEKRCIEIWTQKENVAALIPVHPKIEWIFAIKSNPLFPQYWNKNERDKARLRLKIFLHQHGMNEKGTIHSFRHSFNQRLFEAGFGLEDRQKLLAHSSSKSTGDYTHLNLDLARSAIGSIK